MKNRQNRQETVATSEIIARDRSGLTCKTGIMSMHNALWYARSAGGVHNVDHVSIASASFGLLGA